MSTKYRTKTPLLISVSGLDIELDLDVTYSVSRYRAATLTQPEEPRSVEVESVTARLNGVICGLPSMIEDSIYDSDGFKAALLEEAYEQDMIAAEDAADAKREQMEEDAAEFRRERRAER